jgi:LAS superfamily LD-carboxypeptidase LdcB
VDSGSLDAVISGPVAESVPVPTSDSLDEILRQGQPAVRSRRQTRVRGVTQQQHARPGKLRQASAPGTKRENRPEPETARKRSAVARGTRRLLQAPAKRSIGQLSFTLPQVGIVGVLGLATIAAPITGLLTTPAKTETDAAARTSMQGAPVFPALAQPENAVEDLRLVPEDSRSSVPGALSAPGQVLVSRVTRAGQRAVLPDCDGVVPISSESNGQLPSANLCTLWDGDERLRADAAVALAKMNIAYRKRFGHDMVVTDGYRTLSEQYAIKQSRGWYAATPGTSEHGWGIAVDLGDGVQSRSSATYQWLRANARAYGWYNPAWAQPGGSGPDEPWHWQYRPGEESLGIDEN